MAKLSEMPADEAKERLYDAYMSAHAAIRDGDHDGPHPSKDYSRWREMAATGGLGPSEIERTDHGADTPPDFEGKPANPTNAKPAQDSAAINAAAAVEDAAIRNGGHRDVAGQLWAAAARRSDPARVKRVAAAIPGYDRLK